MCRLLLPACGPEAMAVRRARVGNAHANPALDSQTFFSLDVAALLALLKITCHRAMARSPRPELARPRVRARTPRSSGSNSPPATAVDPPASLDSWQVARIHTVVLRADGTLLLGEVEMTAEDLERLADRAAHALATAAASPSPAPEPLGTEPRSTPRLTDSDDAKEPSECARK